MSIKLMTEVWEHSRASGNSLLLMLAIADFANDQRGAWPAVSTLAKRTRQSERSVQRMTTELQAMGELQVLVGKGRSQCNVYHIPPLDKGCQSVTLSSEIEKGDNLSPFIEKSGFGDVKGDTAVSPRQSVTLSQISQKGDKSGNVLGDTAVSPDPDPIGNNYSSPSEDFPIASEESLSAANALWAQLLDTPGIDASLLEGAFPAGLSDGRLHVNVPAGARFDCRYLASRKRPLERHLGAIAGAPIQIEFQESRTP